jgi:hypothetical protein
MYYSVSVNPQIPYCIVKNILAHAINTLLYCGRGRVAKIVSVYSFA